MRHEKRWRVFRPTGIPLPKLLLLPLCLASAGAAIAQSTPAPALEPGKPVRITAPSLSARPVTGTFERLEAGALVLRGQAGSPFALSAVERLEVRAGQQSNAGRGLGWGIIIGLGTGLAYGAIQTSSCGGGGVCALYLLGAPAVGIGAGALFGAVIGAMVPSPIWGEVPLESLAVTDRPAAATGPGRRAALRVGVRMF